MPLLLTPEYGIEVCMLFEAVDEGARWSWNGGENRTDHIPHVAQTRAQVRSRSGTT
jgi:hypothetical protein